MSSEIHFLGSHLDFFLPNLDAISDEHGKCFHQEISTKEKKQYQGQMEHQHIGHLLLDIGKGGPRCEVQAYIIGSYTLGKFSMQCLL
jgi:hypothetical protein